jgi:fatty-acyl-CoA synthase
VSRDRGLPSPDDLAPLTLGSLLLAAAARRPDHDALVFPGERLTYAELARQAWDVARSLAGLGVGPRERVGLLMPNTPSFVASVFGIALLGATAVPINVRYRTRELRYLIEHAELSAVLTSDVADDHVDLAQLLFDCLPGLAEASVPECLALDGVPRLRAVALLGERRPPGMVHRDAFEAAAERTVDEQLRRWCAGVPMRHTALVLFTSGTTAQPRGVELSHEAFVRTWMQVGRCFGVTEDDRFWDPLPLFHVAALGPLTFMVGNAGTFLSDRHVDAGRALAQIEHERATLLYPTYPPVMQDLLTHPDFPSTDLSSVRAFLNVAPPETLERFQRSLPDATQLTTYGLTEGGPVAITRHDDDEQTRQRTCGRPLPGVEVRIVDETGRERGPGEPGELEMRGPNTLTGYLNDPVGTAAAMAADGWVATGDLCDVDSEGRVRFLGRRKEMLKVGGENVAPAEIEAHLSAHPAVKLVQVVGIPDARLVEVPVAFVELVPGLEATEQQLIDHCSGRIASFKVPRLVRFVHQWPMSATKIQRFKLRAGLLEELQAAVTDEQRGACA